MRREKEMWEGYYGKEPFDLRLTALRMLRQIHIIAAVTIIGTALLGGGYYAKNVLLRGESLYAAESIYRVEYAVQEERDVATVYINETSWNTYIRTQNFINAVQLRMKELNETENYQLTVSDEELRSVVKAVLASDLRVPSTTVTTEDPEKSARIAQAVETAMTVDFPKDVREVTAIAVIHSAETAEEVIPDVRVGRALVLSAVLSCFFGVTVLLLKETGDDSIWLPATLYKRYGLKTLGSLESEELAENIAYLFEGKASVAVCGLQDAVDPVQVLDRLREKAGELPDWFAVPSPLLCPEVCREIRKTDGLLLAVRAGAHAGGQLEHALLYLEQQECKVTAVILWEADEKLIRCYRFGKRGLI